MQQDLDFLSCLNSREDHSQLASLFPASSTADSSVVDSVGSLRSCSDKSLRPDSCNISSQVPAPNLNNIAASNMKEPMNVIPHLASTPFSTKTLNTSGGSHDRIKEQYTLNPAISASCPFGRIQEKNRFSVG